MRVTHQFVMPKVRSQFTSMSTSLTAPQLAIRDSLSRMDVRMASIDVDALVIVVSLVCSALGEPTQLGPRALQSKASGSIVIIINLATR